MRLGAKNGANANVLSEREEIMASLSEMTSVLRERAVELRRTVQSDGAVMDALSEETFSSLDRVSALNSRLRRYVEATSGMTCSMCLMTLTVLLSYFAGFGAIYFV